MSSPSQNNPKQGEFSVERSDMPNVGKLNEEVSIGFVADDDQHVNAVETAEEPVTDGGSKQIEVTPENYLSIGLPPGVVEKLRMMFNSSEAESKPTDAFPLLELPINMICKVLSHINDLVPKMILIDSCKKLRRAGNMKEAWIGQVVELDLKDGDEDGVDGVKVGPMVSASINGYSDLFIGFQINSPRWVTLLRLALICPHVLQFTNLNLDFNAALSQLRKWTEEKFGDNRMPFDGSIVRIINCRFPIITKDLKNWLKLLDEKNVLQKLDMQPPLYDDLPTFINTPVNM